MNQHMVTATLVLLADVAQWQSPSLPSWSCGFDSRHPLQLPMGLIPLNVGVDESPSSRWSAAEPGHDLECRQRDQSAGRHPSEEDEFPRVPREGLPGACLVVSVEEIPDLGSGEDQPAPIPVSENLNVPRRAGRAWAESPRRPARVVAVAPSDLLPGKR